MTIEELVERDTRAQGLPLRLNDPDTVARVAAIVAQTRKAAGASVKSSASPTDQVNEAARSEAGHATQHDHRISAA